MKMNAYRPRHLLQVSRKGFTLIELLAVICIMAVLAALLFPSLSKARQAANEAQCVSNLRQIGRGFSGYVADTAYAPPHWGDPFFSIGSSTSTLLWTGYLAPYLGIDGDVTKAALPRIFDCPEDPDSRTRAANRGFVSTAANWGISYGFNYAYLSSQAGWGRGPYNLRTVRNMTTLVLAGDSLPASKGGQLIALIDSTSAAQNPQVGPDFRHNKGFNGVMLDGHVEHLSSTSLNDQKYWTPLY